MGDDRLSKEKAYAQQKALQPGDSVYWVAAKEPALTKPAALSAAEGGAEWAALRHLAKDLSVRRVGDHRSIPDRRAGP